MLLKFNKKLLLTIIALLFFCGISSKTLDAAPYKNSQLNVHSSDIENIIELCEENSKRELFVNQRKSKDFMECDNINALIGKSEDEIKVYFSNAYCGGAAEDNTEGGIITDPVTYLRNTVGRTTDTYSMVNTKVIEGVGNATCNSLGGGNNCTLTALYNVMLYYRNQGYDKIPADNNTLYSIIKKEATSLGYTASKGLSVTKNNNLVTNTWKDGFGYSSGGGTNNYLWTENTATKSILNNKPFLFSLASGAYYDHTICVYGYEIYENSRTGTRYTFLIVSDGWSTSPRYLAWTNTPGVYVACFTSVNTQ